MSSESHLHADLTRDHRALRRRFLTPEVMSGTILVSVVIAVANEADGIVDVFAATILSMLVVWLSQVFIVTVTVQGLRGAGPLTLRRSLRFALARSVGLLIATIPPLVFLTVGLFGFTDGLIAYWIALWVEVGILFVLGWLAFSQRGVRWYWRLCGAAATAGFGLLIIVLKIVLA